MSQLWQEPGREKEEQDMTEKVSVKDRVYEEILANILNGAYAANTILNERELIEEYSASKTTVREVLVKLCSEGILNNIPRCGYQLEMIHPAQIRELVEFRKTIELAALEAAFPRLGEAEFAQLNRLNEESVSHKDDLDVKIHWTMNNQFHERLCSFSNNSFYKKALGEAMIFSIRASNQYYSQVWSQKRSTDARNHILLVEALQAGDLDRAKEILKGDIEEYMQEITF